MRIILRHNIIDREPKLYSHTMLDVPGDVSQEEADRLLDDGCAIRGDEDVCYSWVIVRNSWPIIKKRLYKRCVHLRRTRRK